MPSIEEHDAKAQHPGGTGLPAVDPALNTKILTVDDPFLGEDVPKPDGDPFDALLQPLLEQDSKQCDAWKEEVQNILIFAGLFSAVITAFIVESYQKLQPDPNDQIVTLLARISDQLAASQNGTTLATPSSSTDVPFDPSGSDLRVNIFWFISLVLSLTVALIGIVTLQWLREHQRYDSGTNPKLKFAIFNARSDGLRRWYVPQIFAALPLLLQSALVLFFVGLTDFLIAIRLEVAIPVVVAVCIPIGFLLATTILPTLQLFAMEHPHLLSVNYRVPAPCPYKSPQSLLSRKLATISETFFSVCAYAFAGVYAPLVRVIRLFANPEKPFYGKAAPFYGEVDNGLMGCIIHLRWVPRDWVLSDVPWLAVRSAHAVVVHTPNTLRDAHERDSGAALMSLLMSTATYDCFRGLKLSGAHSRGHNTSGAIHHCAMTLIQTQCDDWNTKDLREAGDFMRGRYMALMGILGEPLDRLTMDYLHSCMVPNPLDGNGLRNAYFAALMYQILPHDFKTIEFRTTSQRTTESRLRILAPYLLRNTLHIFKCAHTDELLPYEFRWSSGSSQREDMELYCPVWMHDMSKQWTAILVEIIHNSLEIAPSSFASAHTCSSPLPCTSHGHTGYVSITRLLIYIVVFQVKEDIQRTLRLLQHYCTSTPRLLQDLPFVLMIACTYVDAVAVAAGSDDDSMEFRALLDIVSSVCGDQPKTFSTDFWRPNSRQWDGLGSALEYVRKIQTKLNPPMELERRLNIARIEVFNQVASDNV